MAETPRTPATPATDAAGLSRGLRALLAVSLALNLLVLGVVIGAWWRGVPGGGPGGVARAWGGSQAVLYRALPDDLRRELRRDARAQLDRNALRGVRPGPALDAALRADPFDPQAVEALMQRQSETLLDGQRQVRAIWLDKLGRMTPAERAAYADRVAEALRKRHQRP